MAMTVLTLHDVPAREMSEVTPPEGTVRRWRHAVVQGARPNLAPWLAVKAVLTALVLAGQVGIWTAFVLDTALSALVLAYGWWLARR